MLEKGHANRSPVQPAEMGLWAEFSPSLYRNGEENHRYSGRSPELRDVRKQPALSIAHTENSLYIRPCVGCWPLPV